MIDAEKKAFEHAAKLAKEYRCRYKFAKMIAIAECVAIAALICIVMCGGVHG